MPCFAINTYQNANMNLVSLSNIILSNTPCLENTSFIWTCAISSVKISSIQAIKYFYLVNLSIIINILLYSCPVIGSFNFGNFTIKSHNMTSYGLLANLTGCNNPYGLYLLSLFFFNNLDTF